MRQYIHWLEMTGILQHSEPDCDISDFEIVAHTLNLPPSLFKSFTTRNGTTVYTYATSDNLEAVSIVIPQTGYGRVTLRGSFFDAFPTQSILEFKDLMYSLKGNCLRLDNSFKDTSGILNYGEYRRMSELDNYLDYCTGSAVVNKKILKKELPDSTNRKGVPDVHMNHKLIHFGDSNSSQFAKFYECLDGHCKFETTHKNKTHTKILLNAYNPNDMSEYQALAKTALIKIIDFVTPASKRAKRPVQIESYRKFLGSKVEKIKWTTYSPKKQELSKLESFLNWKAKSISHLWSGISKYNLPRRDIEAIMHDIESRLVFPEIIF